MVGVALAGFPLSAIIALCATAVLPLNRLVTVFPQLRRLVETMSTVAAVLVKIMVLYSCVSYTFAAVGMAVFADAKSDLLEPRYMYGTWEFLFTWDVALSFSKCLSLSRLLSLLMSLSLLRW